MNHRSPTSARSVELPHAGAMRWVQEVSPLEDGQGALIESVIGADHPFVQGGELLPTAMMDWMAQTAAAASAPLAAGRGQRVTRGLLAAVQEFSVFGPVPIGSRLEICARRERVFGALSQWRLEARVAGALVSCGRMVFHVTVE